MSSRNERPKQVDRILDYMRRYGSITTLDAMLDLGILRLASRISELKKAGVPIRRDWAKVTNRHGKRATYCATASMAALPSSPISPAAKNKGAAPCRLSTMCGNTCGSSNMRLMKDFRLENALCGMR